MPLYEYRCAQCHGKATLFFRSIAKVEADPACPRCGALGMQRLMSRFWSHRSAPADDGFDAAWPDDDFGGGYGDEPFGGHAENSDEEDPIEFARQAREMAAMFGEPLEPGLDTALRQIEAGADPEEVLGELDEADAGAFDERSDSTDADTSFEPTES